MTRHRWLTSFAVVAVTVGAGRASAQELLTLDQAVQAALTRNASLRAARAASAEASAHVTETRAGFFPRVSFTESWQRGDAPVYVFSSLLSARRFAASNFALDALNHPDALGFFRAGIGLEQLVFDGGRQRALTSAAGLRREGADASADATAADLAVATTETFGRILVAEANARAAAAGLTAAREDLARAERRRDAGLVNDADVLALAVHVADLQQRAIQAEGDAAIGRAELNRLMGAAVDREFQIVAPTPSSESSTGPTLASLLAEADAHRPDLRRSAAMQRAADAEQRQARAGLIPQVVAQAGVDLSGTRFSDRASAWLIGGELRWTFSTGGAQLAGVRAAAEAAARARAEADDVRAAAHVDVVSAVRRLESARARQAAGRAAADQARESQRILRDRFEAGVAVVNDVLRASTAVLDAEANQATALADALVSRAMLTRALGRTP